MPSESKDDTAGTLLGRAVDFHRSNKLSEPLESFARSHAADFEDAVEEESKTGEPLHKLEYTQLHQVMLVRCVCIDVAGLHTDLNCVISYLQEYLALFEDLLNSFLEQEDCSPQTFYM
jgi:hypothetical protein